MASLHVLKSTLSPSLGFQSDFMRRKSSWACSDSGFMRRSNVSSSDSKRGFRVCCRVREGESESNGEEPPESLFMKELRRRGMTPASLLEESNKSMYGVDEDMKLKEDDRGFSKRNAVTTDFQIGEGLANQRERSMALNSEGLEGLIPRAKLLLTLGGTFFLGFWPLILITVAFFSALYFYFGPTFIHDGNRTNLSPLPYIDPYILLEEERISQAAPHVK